jgi:hypothetical protein
MLPCPGIAAAATVMGLAVATLVSAWLLWQGRRRANLPALQVHIDTALVFLRGVLETLLTTYLLDTRLNLLHMARAVISSAHYDVQVSLPSGLGVFYARLQDVFGLFDELAVEINGVLGDAAGAVVLAENELARLLVVALHVSAVLLAFVRQSFRLSTISAIVRLTRPVEARVTLRSFCAREIPQAVILGLGVAIWTVIEGCGDCGQLT